MAPRPRVREDPRAARPIGERAGTARVARGGARRAQGGARRSRRLDRAEQAGIGEPPAELAFSYEGEGALSHGSRVALIAMARHAAMTIPSASGRPASDAVKPISGGPVRYPA